jgi:hypothetical protein
MLSRVIVSRCANKTRTVPRVTTGALGAGVGANAPQQALTADDAKLTTTTKQSRRPRRRRDRGA